MAQIHGVSGSALENGVAGMIAGIARRAINWLERRPTRLAEWLDRLDAAEELRQLNDRMLDDIGCLLYTSPSPRDQRGSRMPSSA